jgi:hypothetical protein
MAGSAIRFQPIDIIAGIFLILWVILKFEKPLVYKQIVRFATILVFSSIMSLTLFGLKPILPGLLYLLRILSFISFFLILSDYFNHQVKKELIIKSLMVVGIVVALLGWMQYVFVPYFGAFRVWGWDDHLYRLVGSFLDPAFTGIILVLSFIISLVFYFNKKRNIFAFLSIIFVISVLFTYSRASYLALFGGFFAWSLLMGKYKYFILIFISLVFLILLLPRPGGAGTQLERTFSISDRLRNYAETAEIVKTYPVFGVGYNNFCLARRNILNDQDTFSHSCSGSDSSLLLVIATTGVVGLLIFINMIMRFIKNTERNVYGLIFLVSITSVFIHSLFVNSLFYPWVMGWLAILAATCQNRSTRSN